MPALSLSVRRVRRLVAPRARYDAVEGAAEADDRTAELAPLLATVDEIDAQAARLRRAAEEEAETTRRAAEAEAERLLVAARERAGQVRAEAAAERQGEIEAEAAELLAEADRASVRVRERAAVRAPALAEQVVARVLALEAPGEAHER